MQKEQASGSREAIALYRQTILRLNPEVTPEEWDYFESGFTFYQLNTGDFFAEADKINQLLGFVTKGLVRGYYLNEAGDEITISFDQEGDWVADYPSMLNHRPSRYYFQCLEPAELICVPFEHIRKGYAHYRGFERNGRLIAEMYLSKLQKRIAAFQFDSAEQRYLDFVRENPELFNRVSLTHLASYIGIERPSLSRIRKRVAGR